VTRQIAQAAITRHAAAARLGAGLELSLSRLASVFAGLNGEAAARLIDTLLAAKTVFVAGAGRSGLAARCFAMRLAQLDVNVHVAGDTIAPAARAGDILLILSGSGETPGMALLAEKAVAFGADVAAVTANSMGKIARLAKWAVILPVDAASGEVADSPNGPLLPQPLASLFEQASLLFLDAISGELMFRLGRNEADMRNRHANLE
jgi:6-phospho-3-hexuloisomerase